jgi:hypothetical protein
MRNTKHFEYKQSIEEQKFDSFAKYKNITRYNYTALECPFDVKMKSGSTYIIAETKVREDYDLEFFSKYGAYLEYKKIDGMVRERERIKKQNGVDVELYYFNFTSNGLQVFALKEPQDYQFEWKYLPKDNIDKNNKIYKLVATLKEPTETLHYK